MNKKELVAQVANEMGSTNKEAAIAVDTVFGVVSDALGKGDKVSLTGFGVFEVVKRNERKCRNLQTGDEMVVPAKMAPKFRPAKALKQMVSELPVS